MNVKEITIRVDPEAAPPTGPRTTKTGASWTCSSACASGRQPTVVYPSRNLMREISRKAQSEA